MFSESAIRTVGRGKWRRNKEGEFVTEGVAGFPDRGAFKRAVVREVLRKGSGTRAMSVE